MAEHLLFSDHLTSKEVHRPIAETYLGQAHIAGTGPAGTTCRECKFWCLIKHRKDSFGNYQEHSVHPGYFSPKHAKAPGEAKKAKCNRPILNKAKRLIPHHAKSCRLFEAAEIVMPAKKAVMNG